MAKYESKDPPEGHSYKQLKVNDKIVQKSSHFRSTIIQNQSVIRNVDKAVSPIPVLSCTNKWKSVESREEKKNGDHLNTLSPLSFKGRFESAFAS
ncbi:hypothetical protein TNCV_1807351 [Trichonephila clavipes]|nr:hypothetical protein TNCV_1807351 [Trichonephila clavipes]